jgi:thiol-disulfide isomerase/thioredoxin
MRRILFLAAILFCCTSVAPAAIKVGDRPSLQFTTLDGQTLTLAQYGGKMVILDFWASWCGPAMQDAPHLLQLEKQYGPQGLSIVGVSLDRSVADAQQAAKDAGFDWPEGCDCQGWNSPLCAFWRVDAIPRAYLISPDGEILWIGLPSQIDGPLADAFKTHPPPAVNPEVRNSADWNLTQAEAIADADPAGAIAALALVPVAAMQLDPIAQRTLALQDQLLPAAEKELADFPKITDPSQYVAAAVEMKNISKAFAGTPVAAAADTQLSQKHSDPVWHKAIAQAQRQLLAAKYFSDAQRLASEKNDYAAYPLFQRVASMYPGEALGNSARQALAIYDRDPNFAQRARDYAAAPNALPMLEQGQAARAAGNIPDAIVKFRGVVELFPNTTFAATAQSALTELTSPKTPAASGN